MVGGSYTAEGLEHDETGAPAYDPELHTRNMQKRFRKLETAGDEIRTWPESVWYYGHPNPEVGIVGWGSTSGPVREAIDRANAQGMKVRAFYPRFLSPLPEEELADFVASLRAVIVPELNYRGQLADIIQAKFCMRITRLNKCTGESFTAADIYEKIIEYYAR
jgi:2-oxoglutarate ferredoxin oxidoreductase subunit alpha